MCVAVSSEAFVVPTPMPVSLYSNTGNVEVIS